MSRHHLRFSLLAGAGMLCLASLPAFSQATTSATGTRSLVNAQSAQGSPITTDLLSTPSISVQLGGLSNGITASVADNQITTEARANRADLTLTTDPLASAASDGPAKLVAGAASVSADGEAVIANRQTMSVSPVDSAISGSDLALNVGAVGESQANMTGNTQAATGAGNQLSAALTTDGASAGIATRQSTDRNSTISGVLKDQVGIAASSVSNAQLGNTGNLDRGIAAANSSDAKLTAATSTVSAPAGTDSHLPATGSDDASISANYAIVSNQSAGGNVTARAGGLVDAPAFGVSVTGGIGASTATLDANTAIAGATANQADNIIDLSASTVSAGDGPSLPGGVAMMSAHPVGTVADIANVQRSGAATGAITRNGSTMNIGQGISDSTLSVSDNLLRAGATANLASNTLSASAASLDTGGTGFGSTDADGSLQQAGAFAVQNMQDYGTGGVGTTQIAPASTVHVMGSVYNAGVSVGGNSVLGTAGGNVATNDLSLSGGNLNTSASINSLQVGDGSVVTQIGDSSLGAGAHLVVGGRLHGGTLSASTNNVTGTSIGNSGTNSMEVSGASFGSDAGDAMAGPIDTGYGATAGFALASNQKVGETVMGGALTPNIASSVYGSDTITVGGAIEGSKLSIDGNTQRANALANVTVNDLSVAGTKSSAALSSSQYGQANITALSDAKFAATGGLLGSSTSLTGNSNVALAAVNDAANTLSAGGSGGEGSTTSALSSGLAGPPVASGGQVLASQQFADGSVAATATTRLGDTVASGLNASQFRLADNVTSAEASANRATNTVSIDGVGSGTMAAGLVNTQFSDAAVRSIATTGANYATVSSGGVAVSDVSMTGNTTSALARGNVANNAVSATGAGSTFEPTTATASRFDASLQAPGSLLNAQQNVAPVWASVLGSGYDQPLNGLVRSSEATISGNTVTASAYGNQATNVLTTAALGSLAAAGLVNNQSNSGAVTAQASGVNFAQTAIGASASRFAVTGNQLSATAVGNMATSRITTPR